MKKKRKNKIINVRNGELVKKRRTELGWSLDDVSYKVFQDYGINIRKSVISEIESGIRSATTEANKYVPMVLGLTLPEVVLTEEDMEIDFQEFFFEEFTKNISFFNYMKEEPRIYFESEEIYKSYVTYYDESNVLSKVGDDNKSDPSIRAWLNNWEIDNRFILFYNDDEERMVGVRGYGKYEILAENFLTDNNFIPIDVREIDGFCNDAKELLERIKGIYNDYRYFLMKALRRNSNEKSLIVLAEPTPGVYYAREYSRCRFKKKFIIYDLRDGMGDYRITDEEGMLVDKNLYRVTFIDDEMSRLLGMAFYGKNHKINRYLEVKSLGSDRRKKKLGLNEKLDKIYENAVVTFNKGKSSSSSVFSPLHELDFRITRLETYVLCKEDNYKIYCDFWGIVDILRKMGTIKYSQYKEYMDEVEKLVA